MLAARYRVEVRDRDGKLVTVLEGDSKSFNINFINLLIASHYNKDNVPVITIYNVIGNPFYTGSIISPYIGLPLSPFNMDFSAWSYFPDAYHIAIPAVWLGTSPCANPALANGPCGSLAACCYTIPGNPPYPLTPYDFSWSANCCGHSQLSPVLTEDGWALTITNPWLNMSGSPVTVASMALMSGVYTVSPGPTEELNQYTFQPYAIIVDNLPSPITIQPGYLITVSYTIYFPV